MIQLGRSLAKMKADATVAVDRGAEMARLRFITSGAGQALEYQATEAEARRAVVDPSPDFAGYPFLAAEWHAGGNVGGVVDIADVVLVQTAAWQMVGSEIKRLRRTAKIAIDAATSAAEVAAAANISWPAPG